MSFSLYDEVEARYPRGGPLTAREFAIKAHGEQLYGTEPYVVHLDEVVAVLREFGMLSPIFGLLAQILEDAGYLHDVIEDTDASKADIESLFGEPVAQTVLNVTNDVTIGTKQERRARTYRRIASDDKAIVLKLADRIANVRRCIRDKNPKLARYRREYPEFKKALSTKDVLFCRKMWLALDALIYGAPDTITEDWLRESGFKWHQAAERQPSKNWILWLSGCFDCGKGYFSGSDELGIEVCFNGARDEPFWFCWLRSDIAHRYHRFIHIRHLRTRAELISLIEGLTGTPWTPANHIYGTLQCQRCADRSRKESERLDRQQLETSHPWHEQEKDPDRARPMAEDLDAAIKAGVVK